MILVNAPFRRRGFATALLRYCIDHLRNRGLVPMLDATPAGRAVYLPLGFVDIEPISRWRGGGAGSEAPSPMPSIEEREIDDLDAAAFGARRTPLLRSILQRPGALVSLTRQRDGFLLTRAGRTATQIGPVAARDEPAALRLVGEALQHLCGPVLLDVPDRCREIAALLIARGFTIERGFVRMAMGSDRAFGDGSGRVIAGPELG